MKILPTIFACFFVVHSVAQCNHGMTSTQLSGNTINASSSVSGEYLWNYNNNNSGYEVPSGSGKYTIFSSSFWIGAIDNLGNIRASIGRYWSDDYWPGPIDNQTGQSYNCSSFDQIWEVHKSSVVDFLANGNITSEILNWPGRNNPNLSFLPQNQDMAPFVDVDVDGNYNPSNGDYPDIKGDIFQYFVINDVGGIDRTTNGDSLGIEVHVMVYQYGNIGGVLDYTTFYDVKVVNKSSNTYSEAYMGVFEDIDIGYAQDDFIGCDTILEVGYNYNAFEVDQVYDSFPPVQGVTMLKPPSSNTQVASFSSFVNVHQIMGPQFIQNDPVECYNYMKGMWPDSTLMSYGGIGYDTTSGAQPFPFQYPGSLCDSTQWSEVSTNHQPSDRVFLMSYGALDFTPLESIDFTFAHVTTFPDSASQCDWVPQFLNDVSSVHNFYNSVIASDINEYWVNEIKIYPNPASEFLKVSGLSIDSEMFVYDILGKQIDSKKVNTSSHTIDISGYPGGIFFVKIQKETDSHTFKFVVEH